MSSRLHAQGSYPTVHVRDFDARGDGATNDTDALFAASGYIASRGGGTIVFDRATYLIGKQRRGPGPLGWAFEPQPVIDMRAGPPLRHLRRADRRPDPAHHAFL